MKRNWIVGLGIVFLVAGVGTLLFFNLGKVICIIQGGKLGKAFGPMPSGICVKVFKDADKECTDGSQCEGRMCIAPVESAVGAQVKGKCVDVQPFLGCSSNVRNGKKERVVCGM